jgi:WD40 repeat protein
VNVRVLEVGTGKEHWRLKGRIWQDVAFSPDGRFLAWVTGTGAQMEEQDLHMLDVAHKREIRLFNRCSKGYPRMRFTLRADLLAVITDSTKVVILDVATGKKRYLLDHGSSADFLDALAISADGRFLASGSRDDKINIWDLSTGKLQRRLSSPTPSSLAFSPDGKTLACGTWNHAIHLWDTASWEERVPAKGHHGLVSFVAFMPDGQRLLTGSYDRTARLWDLSNAREILRFEPFPKSSFPAAALSPKGNILASNGGTAETNSIQLWDPARGKLLKEIGLKQRMYRLVFFPDGKRLVILGGKNLFLWDLDRRQEVEDFQPSENDGFLALAGNNPGRFLVAMNREAVVLWDLKGRELRRLAWEPRSEALAVSPDGRMLAVSGLQGADDPEVFGASLLELATGKVRLRLEKADIFWHESTQPLAFSPDGRILAVPGKNKKALVCDVATGQVLVELGGHEGEVASLAFSGDGRFLATTSLDTTALVWDVSRWTGSQSRRPPLVVRAKEMDHLIQDLAGADAKLAYRAMKSLEDAGPAAAALLGRSLQPFPFPDPKTEKRIAQLINQLKHAQFPQREKAMRALEELEDLAEPALLRVFKNAPSEEVRRRVALLLKRLDPRHLTSKRVFQVRALEVLGHMGTGEARTLLESLARGNSHAWLTQESAKTLGFLREGRGKKRD